MFFIGNTRNPNHSIEPEYQDHAILNKCGVCFLRLMKNSCMAHETLQYYAKSFVHFILSLQENITGVIHLLLSLFHAGEREGMFV